MQSLITKATKTALNSKSFLEIYNNLVTIESGDTSLDYLVNENLYFVQRSLDDMLNYLDGLVGFNVFTDSGIAKLTAHKGYNESDPYFAFQWINGKPRILTFDSAGIRRFLLPLISSAINTLALAVQDGIIKTVGDVYDSIYVFEEDYKVFYIVEELLLSILEDED